MVLISTAHCNLEIRHYVIPSFSQSLMTHFNRVISDLDSKLKPEDEKVKFKEGISCVEIVGYALDVLQLRSSIVYLFLFHFFLRFSLNERTLWAFCFSFCQNLLPILSAQSH